MGVKTRNFQPFFSFLIFNFLINCDKTLINCDLVIEQSQSSKDLELSKMFQTNNSDDNNSNLNINSTQLKQIVMEGLSMTTLPNMDKVSSRIIMEILKKNFRDLNFICETRTFIHFSSIGQDKT